MLKVDVEGAERGVLDGALETIRRHRPLILFEHGPMASRLYGTTSQSIHDLLVGVLGYRISALDDDRPYDCVEFVQVVKSGARYNFVACPS